VKRVREEFVYSRETLPYSTLILVRVVRFSSSFLGTQELYDVIRVDFLYVVLTEVMVTADTD
jgi:hypothetical protein